MPVVPGRQKGQRESISTGESDTLIVLKRKHMTQALSTNGPNGFANIEWCER